MSTIQVTLPASVSEYVERQIAEGRFRDATDYVCSLILSDQQHETLEAELLRGLRSGPAREFTTHDWDAMRSEVRRLHSQRTATESVGHE